MGLSYINIKFLLHAVNLARSLDHNRINQMITYATSMLGPGGNIEWNSQGTDSTKLHIGRVNATSTKIEVVLSSSYVMYTNAFTDLSIQCEWLTGVSKSFPYYNIIFLYITDNYFQYYMNYYLLYNNIMTDYFNLKNGVNNRLLKVSTKIFSTIDTLKSYVEENSDDPNLLAYFGTTTNEQRDIISPILKQHDKFLFSIHPSEGMRCYENIIQVGRIPNHYAMASIATVWQFSNSRTLAIVMCDNQYCHDVGDAIGITADTMRDLKTFRYYLNSTYTFDNVTEEMKKIETDKLMIFTVLGMETTDFITTLIDKEMSKEKFTVVSLDVLIEWIDSEVWEGHDFFVSYTTQSQSNSENENFITEFIERFGDNEQLLNEHTLSIYTSLMILKTAYAKAQDESFNEIKRQIKGLSIDLPVGTIKVRDDMVCSNSYVFVEVNNGAFKIILKTINPMALTAYLAYVFIYLLYSILLFIEK